MRIVSGNDVEYQPEEFHAYYGDRVGVTYYTATEGDKELHQAFRVVLLTTNPDRITELRLGAVDGIIRASGMMRNLVYLPEYDLTVAFYKFEKVKYSPKNWSPKKGNKVKIYFSEDSGRFVRKFMCIKIHRLGKDPVSIQDKTETGVITDIFVHRSVKSAPDRFAFQLNNGNTLTMFAGGETTLIPKDRKVYSGGSYSIQYYRLLMGDQSLRYVATQIEGVKIDYSQHQEGGYKLLNRDEIKTAIAGNTIHFEEGSKTYIIYFKLDGQIRGLFKKPFKNAKMFTGRWSVSEENLYCDNLPKKQGVECDRIYLRGNEILFKKLDGRPSFRGILEQGNSRGL
jgi:hypothetical protein